LLYSLYTLVISFHWMLDFSLAPRFRCASAQAQSTHTTFSPHSWLALASCLDVQSTHTRLQKQFWLGSAP
jgi:hypothetical protein